MAPSRVREGSLRLGRLELTRLAWAFGISLAVHLFCYGGYEIGKKFNVALRLPPWVQKLARLVSPPKADRKPAPQEEMPLVFIDVNPHQAATEAPKNAKFYSNKNSQAANPEANQDTGVPKITGKQTEMAKAEDTKRSPFDKLQPDFTHAARNQPAEAAKPKSPTPPGDLAMAKPDTTPRQDTGVAEQPRPRTLKEALMREHRSQLAGEKMKQDGGVNRLRLDPGFDAKATPFGEYDAAFIEAVEQRWFDLLDNMSYNGYQRGKVVLGFHLNYDGRITDLRVVESTVGETLSLLCQKAVLDPAPFDKWPREMRLMVDKDYRDIQFTFYYN